MKKPGYRDRAIGQLMMWVNGQPKHNTVDNECCPDFSCCYPDLLKGDQVTRGERMRQIIERMER